LVVGVLLALHGWQKGAHPNQFAEYVGTLDVAAPEFAATAVILLEIGLGAMLVVGLATRLAGALLAGHMVMIWTVVHSGGALVTDGRSGITGELALLYLAAGLGLFATGSGQYAVDSFLGGRGTKAAHSTPRHSTLNHSNGSPEPDLSEGTPPPNVGASAPNGKLSQYGWNGTPTTIDAIELGGPSRRRSAR
jgi:putative oxidoreductase